MLLDPKTGCTPWSPHESTWAPAFPHPWCSHGKSSLSPRCKFLPRLVNRGICFFLTWVRNFLTGSRLPSLGTWRWVVLTRSQCHLLLDSDYPFPPPHFLGLCVLCVTTWTFFSPRGSPCPQLLPHLTPVVQWFFTLSLHFGARLLALAATLSLARHSIMLKHAVFQTCSHVFQLLKDFNCHLFPFMIYCCSWCVRIHLQRELLLYFTCALSERL